MKTKRILKAGIAVLFALAFLCALWAGFNPPVFVSAYSDGSADASAYIYTIEKFDVQIDLKSDRTAYITETITASFTGWNSHGIIRDLPLGSGVRYRNLTAECDNADFDPYVQNDDSSFLSYYLRGEGIVRGQERTYTIKYEMLYPDSGNRVPLNILGYGWQTTVNNFTATVTLPEGMTDYGVCSGRAGSSLNDEGVDYQQTETGFTFSAPQLLQNYSDGNGNRVAAGIMLDLLFEEGVLSTVPDYTPLWVCLIGVAAVLIALLFKFLFCRQPDMVVPVGLEAPDEMDPLTMGKLIDNSVDSEDMGALVFWLASQGYIKIDFTEKSDPTLYRTEKQYDDKIPNHCRTFCDGLFKGDESVQISKLRNKFYKTADAVKTVVNAKSATMYDKGRSFGLLAVFALITVLALGGFAVLYPVFTVVSGYWVWTTPVACLIAFIAAAFGSQLAAQRRYKWKKKFLILSALVGLAAGVLVGLFFAIFSNAAYGFLTRFLAPLFAGIAGLLSGTFLTRTETYTKQLGKILGFKQFIVFTERDKIEFMLQQDPELYYNILPYAQVLGVTDAWTDKFKDLNLNPPSYMYGSSDVVFDCILWNTMFHSFNSGFSGAAVSRPSSSGGFRGGGGFGGGFGGGGFGGGGGRGC